jgi:hypothetical protein
MRIVFVVAERECENRIRSHVNIRIRESGRSFSSNPRELWMRGVHTLQLKICFIRILVG